MLIAKRNGQPVNSSALPTSAFAVFTSRPTTCSSSATLRLRRCLKTTRTRLQQSKKLQNRPDRDPVDVLAASSRPPVHFCFSPHKDPELSLGPIAAAIDQPTSSVLFSIAFLSQSKSGPVRESIDRLEGKSLFSYGISDRKGGLQVKKPDGSLGIVDFEYLAKHAPEPFKSEWSGGAGRHEHHKFVVTDFSLPTAKVFTGSCNMSVSGEKANGDNLVMIEDSRVATSYAIEGLRVFDHLHFRTKMQAADEGITRNSAMAKPTSISGQPAWFGNSTRSTAKLPRIASCFPTFPIPEAPVPA